MSFLLSAGKVLDNLNHAILILQAVWLPLHLHAGVEWSLSP